MKGGTWTQHALTKPVFGTKAVKILSLTKSRIIILRHTFATIQHQHSSSIVPRNKNLITHQ